LRAVFFLCNSGAETNEECFRLASCGETRVVADLEARFHGRTSGAVATTDNP
jgi:acetylornithine/succinyldiaminopimelate/putrescine aminotransferase